MCEARIHMLSSQKMVAVNTITSPVKEARRRYDAEARRAQRRNVCKANP